MCVKCAFLVCVCVCVKCAGYYPELGQHAWQSNGFPYTSAWYVGIPRKRGMRLCMCLYVCVYWRVSVCTCFYMCVGVCVPVYMCVHMCVC